MDVHASDQLRDAIVKIVTAISPEDSGYQLGVDAGDAMVPRGFSALKFLTSSVFRRSRV